MKDYVKPDVFVSEYQLNSAIAACSPTQVDPSPQNIKCSIVSGQVHNVFYNSCETNATTSGRLVPYGGKTYFIWSDNSSKGQPSWEGEQLIQALGVKDGEHAGIANAAIISIINAS